MENSRKIIVSEREYHSLLFHLKRSDPTLGHKIIDVDALLDHLTFRFEQSPIPILLKQGLDYASAKKWMRVFRTGDISLSPQAKKLFETIPASYYSFDPLGEYELNHAEVWLLELQEDVALHSLLKRKGIAFKDITLASLGAKTYLSEQPTITLFKNKYEQFSYLFASLRKRIIEEGLNPQDVLIHVKDESDFFFLRLLGDMYGIKTRFKRRILLLSYGNVSSILEKMHAKRSLALEEEEAKSEEGKLLQQYIKEFELDQLPFDLAYASLLEIAQSTAYDSPIEDRGIQVSTDFTFAPDKEIYLTDFQYGRFYQVFADEDVLSDEALLAIGGNPSYIKTRLDCRKKWNYLKYQHFALLSRVKEHLDEKIYESQFYVKDDWKIVSGPDAFTPAGLYTTTAANAFHVRELDEQFVHSPVGDYLRYDSRFKGIEGASFASKSYSVTKLEKYIRCPYQFYLSTLLPEADYDKRPRFMGTMTHKVLERLYQPDFDLDKAIEEGKAAYIEDRDRNDEPLPVDEIFMALTEMNLRRYVPFFLKQKEHAKILSAESEKEIRYTLEDEQIKADFRGFIDAVLLVGDGQSKYFVILDYKTGSESFLPYEVFLGASTQLPLYYYALKQMEYGEENQALFGGMGIKHVGFADLSSLLRDSSSKQLSAKKGFEKMSLQGVASGEESFWQAFDDTGIKTSKKETEIKGSGRFLKVGKAMFDLHGEGHLSGMASGRAYSLEEMLEDAAKATLDTIKKIQAGDFPLAPSNTSDLRKAPSARDIACARCPFADVCYHVISRDAADYGALIQTKFLRGDEEENR